MSRRVADNAAMVARGACALVLLSVLAGTARADIASLQLDVPASREVAAVVLEQRAAEADASVSLSSSATADLCMRDLLLASSGAGTSFPRPLAAPEPDTGSAVQSLPPPPDSLYIALSGLATFGTARLVRQAKHIHWVALPEWYHAGGPGQVGHAVALQGYILPDLMPVCWYQPCAFVAVSGRSAVYDRQAGRSPCRQQRYFVPTTTPRSPPLLP